jgi:hypothetical protein
MSLMRKTLAIGGTALLVAFVLLIVLALGLMAGLQHLVNESGGPLTLRIDDETIVLGQATFAEALVAGAAILFALLVVCLVIALVLPVTLGVVGLALALALGAPLLAVALLALVFAAPFLIIGGIVWLVVRRRSPPRAGATTMAA